MKNGHDYLHNIKPSRHDQRTTDKRSTYTEKDAEENHLIHLLHYLLDVKDAKYTILA